MQEKRLLALRWGLASFGGRLLGVITHLNQQQDAMENAMSTAISWVFEAAIKPDGLDEYRVLAQEINAENEAAEPDQVIFEWFIDDHDVHIYERYTDSAAALSHVQRFVANFADRFLSLCTPTRMSVYGEPSDELKAAITGFNPRYFGTLAGHARP